MRNNVISAKTTNDIDNRVERLLQGLGYPEPPLSLIDIQELLKLDIKYYTATDPNMLDDIVNRIRVASIQVYKRPSLLLDVVKKLSLKALYLPDKKRILLDNDLPKLKHRWNTAHEIGHSILPWHGEVMLGDNEHTLSKSCHESFEREANLAAGNLLFLRNRFLEEALSRPFNFNGINELKNIFGNTISSTLYHFVETIGVDKPMLGMISCHPHIDRRPVNFDVNKPCRHFILSPAFLDRFGLLTEHEIFQMISSYSGFQGGGILGGDNFIIKDKNRDPHIFYFETFFNRYDALTLGVYVQESKSFF